VVSLNLAYSVDAHKNILSPTCLTVFVKSKTENQLIRLSSKQQRKMWNSCCNARPQTSLLQTWPPNIPHLNTVDYRYLEYCSNVFIGNLLKTERWWTEVASDWSVVWHPSKCRWSGNCMCQSQRKAFWKHAMMCCSTTVNNLLLNLHSVIFCFTTFNQSWLKVLALVVEQFLARLLNFVL